MRPEEQRCDLAAGIVLHHDVIEILVGHGGRERRVDGLDVVWIPGACASDVVVRVRQVSDGLAAMEDEIVFRSWG